MTRRRETQKERRQRLKQKLVDVFGGQCVRCGGVFPSECYDFHHTDPRTKAFAVDQQRIAARAWVDVFNEASKCLMLCANCHRTIHTTHEEGYFEDAYRRHRNERTAT